MISPSIFREYDIRGIWGKDLTEEAALLIGKGFGTYIAETLKKPRCRISVGRDVRLSSPAISEQLINGLVSTGAEVYDIGPCPTPVQYFSIHHLGLDGGIMITGSHNPPDYNGFKVSVGRETIYGDAIQSLRRRIEAGNFLSGDGKVTSLPVIPQYKDYLKGGFKDFSGIKVVVDAGNGTAGLLVPELLREMGAEVTELFCEPDGRFPNHHPDPVVAGNLVDMIQEVKKVQAHLGVAYDGDSDRLGVVDEKGGIIWGDRLMIIYGRDIVKTLPGAKIIGEVKCSQVMYDEIKRCGGSPIMWKTGHSLIKKKMKEEKAALAGEMSGHIFFADRYLGYDDAVYATLRLLEILKESGQPYSLSRLLEGLPEVHSTPEIRFDCDDSIKFKVPEKVREAFSGNDVITIDGARINFKDGWALVRASNTQPVLVLRFEASNEKALDEIRTLVEERLQQILKEMGEKV